jgi:hypothetical protein
MGSPARSSLERICVSRGIGHRFPALHQSADGREHDGRIMRNLHVHSTTDLVRLATQHGLLDA